MRRNVHPGQRQRGVLGRDRAAVRLVEGMVDTIVPGGRGLLRHANGAVFARGALPGERVEVAIERSARGVHHGVVVRVLEASPHRVTPDCPLHGPKPGHCGGCDLLDLSLPAARHARERIVDDALVRVGRLPPDLVARSRRPLVALAQADDPNDALRRRVRVVIRNGAATLSSAESHARVPVSHCAALHPRLDNALARLERAGLRDNTVVRLACDDRGRLSAALENARREDAHRIVDTGVADGAVMLGHMEGAGQFGSTTEDVAGDPILAGEIAPGYNTPRGPARSDAGVFSQATRFGGRAIIRAVLEAAELARDAQVLELFAGSGHLTIPMLSSGAQVHAIEGAARGFQFLQENVVAYGAQCSTQQSFIDSSLPVSGPIDVLVADPPRTGIPEFAALLSRICPSRLVLVSCDPATGARDLACAIAAGHTLEWLEPIDAFPRTSHVEWVASLRRTR